MTGQRPVRELVTTHRPTSASTTDQAAAAAMTRPAGVCERRLARADTRVVVTPTLLGVHVAVRSAAIGDAAEMGRLHVLSWRAAYRGLIAQDYLDNLDIDQRAEHWRRTVARAREHAPLLVAVAGGEVVGFTGFGPVLDRDSELPTVGQLYGIDVRPDRWGQGVGRALLAAVHTGLVDLDYRSAVLWVLPGNQRACQVYEHYGWRYDGGTRTAEVFGLALPELRYRRELP
jgi:RimJ/RimL family protein N-acetyltransferase